MHITRVEVENFKRLKEVDIDDLGQVVTIGGRNAQGKSSLVDAIWNTLGGKQRAVTRPIRDGEEKATAAITVESEDGTGFVATRTWKLGKASTLTVRPINGKANVAGGQTFIDQFLGAFAFDPLAFAEQDSKKQRQTLIDLVGVDTSAIDEEYDVAYEGRRMQGQEVKRIEGSLGSMDRPAKGVPDDYVSVTALSDELNAVRVLEQDLSVAKDNWSRTNERIKDLRAQLGRAESELENLAASGKAAGDALEGSRRASDILVQIDDAETMNASVRDAERYRETKEELKQAERRHSDLEKRVETARQAKVDALAAVDLPLEGLSFDEEGILYNGVPFSQSSAAERRRVSVAMAMAMNPELKVICLKDASLLDEESLADLKRLGEENGFQLFLEVVGKPGGETFVIEDGEIA